ncbi:hypothetical protein [Paenirhodobacter sp.]|uniref:hypothetical protein n=1 Tax=Paenirhodobacter sp. TaxID=1965326 RepID=UPI003B40F1C3
MAIDLFRGKAVTIPPMDGPFRPITVLAEAPVFADLPEPDLLASGPGGVLRSSGHALNPLSRPSPRRFWPFAVAPDGTRVVAQNLNSRPGKAAEPAARHPLLGATVPAIAELPGRAGPTSGFTRDSIIAAMVGRGLSGALYRDRPGAGLRAPGRKILSVQDLSQGAIVYVTKDRKAEGFFETMGIAETPYSGLLTPQPRLHGRPGGTGAAGWTKRLNIRAINDTARVVELSDGNPQKQGPDRTAPAGDLLLPARSAEPVGSYPDPPTGPHRQGILPRRGDGGKDHVCGRSLRREHGNRETDEIPAVKAMFDHIRATRNRDFINNF